MFENLNYSYYPPSRLTIGCEPLGGNDWGKYDVGEVRKTISMAIDYGITSFDTADVYGLGKSEEELSKALGEDRHKAFIISKVGVRWEKNVKSQRSKTFKDSSPEYIRTALENSLRRLRVEAIPLYMVHWPDKKSSNNNVMECLESLKVSGKILNYGISNFDGNLTRKHLETPTPFNTYTEMGLPPTPISNPGWDSLHSALQPASVKYLYFVARGDGSSAFSRTLREHQRAVWKYQVQPHRNSR